jgi:hypothetical protein
MSDIGLSGAIPKLVHMKYIPIILALNLESRKSELWFVFGKPQVWLVVYIHIIEPNFQLYVLSLF